LGVAVARHALDDTQILWVPRREHAHYEGMTIAAIARERKQDATETYLDLVGELAVRPAS